MRKLFHIHSDHGFVKFMTKLQVDMGIDLERQRAQRFNADYLNNGYENCHSLQTFSAYSLIG